MVVFPMQSCPTTPSSWVGRRRSASVRAGSSSKSGRVASVGSVGLSDPGRAAEAQVCVRGFANGTLSERSSAVLRAHRAVGRSRRGSRPTARS